MTGLKTVQDAAAAARRQWLIVVLATLVALTAAYFASTGIEDVHTGTADVRIDISTQARVRGMPRPDDVIRAATNPGVREAVADALGVEVGEVAGSLSAVGKGNPQTLIVVSYESDTAEAAKAGASAGAEALVEWVHEAVAADIELKTKQVELTREALDGLVVWEGATPAEEQSTMQSRINTEIKLLDLENDLYITLNVYSYDGEVSESVVTASSVMQRNLVGAAVAGLVLGLILAALREGLARLSSSG